MLVLCAEQLGQLGQASDEAFLRQAAARVAQHWPQRTARLGPEALMARLRAVHRLALEHGIRERPDLLRLANMAMALDDDPGSPACAWVRPILGDTRLRPGDRLDVLDVEIREWLRERRVPR